MLQPGKGLGMVRARSMIHSSIVRYHSNDMRRRSAPSQQIVCIYGKMHTMASSPWLDLERAHPTPNGPDPTPRWKTGHRRGLNVYWACMWQYVEK